MTLAVPKFHETFIPILKVLESGEVLHHEDMKRRVKEQFFAHLPNEIFNQKTSSGVLLILNGYSRKISNKIKCLRKFKRRV